MSEQDKRTTDFGTTECPHCKKQVSKKPGPYAIHTKKCEMINKAANAIPGIKNEDVRRTMEKALAVQKSMLESPELATVDLSVDVNMSLRKRYAPETLENYDAAGKAIHTHTAYFGDAREMSVDISKGFIPVLNENQEYVVNMGGDILYTRPLEISQRIERASQMESRNRLASVTQQAQTRSSAKGVEAPNTADGEITEEEYGVAGTLTLAPGEV
jgi:hypothetical protein